LLLTTFFVLTSATNSSRSRRAFERLTFPSDFQTAWREPSGVAVAK
jgi:hypothetical protein